tara:strand:+ start:135 stop:344 length:210 start_codon:yes stop_codon:yes gene_type:complete
MNVRSKNKLYLLTIEYNSDTEEIEYIEEQIIDNRELEEVAERGTIDMEELQWDIDDLEYMREHYTSGQS